MSCPRTSLIAGSVLAAMLSFGVIACAPTPEMRRQLEQLTAISVEKDSLLLQVMENARLMSDISSEIVRVRSPAATTGAAEAPAHVSPDAILHDIRELTQRIMESEERLAQSQERIENLTRDNTQMTASVRDFQKAAGDLQATIASQRETIATLMTEVEQLRDENQRLAFENTTLVEENVALFGAVEDLTDRDNTVYYVAGTRDELIQNGVIEEEGGSRVLFVLGRRGKTWVPGRNLDPSYFTAIDRRDVTEIPLPRQDREYRIASRQDVSALDEAPDKDGDIRGAVRIADPDRFWANSRYLILVQR
jgi:hypothetical protein